MADDRAFLDPLDPRYRLILCDVWGVIHDGVQIFPGVGEQLGKWREEGRRVILVTNAPRPADIVAKELAIMGMPASAFDFVVTSGEAGLKVLKGLGRPVGFLGTEEDRAIVEERGLRIADDDDFSDLACIGTEESRPTTEQYREDLERWAVRDVLLHCLNPDRIVIHGGVPEVCAGAIADLYEKIGGRVAWYGKPHEPMYRHALSLAGDPPTDEILAIGDGLQTDMIGAARMGLDAVFVRGGIHVGEPFPEDFGERNGLGDWRPVAVVDALAF